MAFAIVVTASLRIVVFPYGANPWLMVLAMLCLGWRGPGWRRIGLQRPDSFVHTITVGVVLGVGYQVVGTYLIEPLLGSLTGALPDASQFRSLVGDKRQLAFWIAISWTYAAFLEEFVFRGWLLNRCAEVGGFTTGGWVVGVLATSAIFGFFHMYQGLSGIIATGLTGLAFGVTFLATRNLWACVVAHGVLDTTGFALMYFGVYPGM